MTGDEDLKKDRSDSSSTSAAELARLREELLESAERLQIMALNASITLANTDVTVDVDFDELHSRHEEIRLLGTRIEREATALDSVVDSLSKPAPGEFHRGDGCSSGPGKPYRTVCSPQEARPNRIDPSNRTSRSDRTSETRTVPSGRGPRADRSTAEHPRRSGRPGETSGTAAASDRTDDAASDRIDDAVSDRTDDAASVRNYAENSVFDSGCGDDGEETARSTDDGTKDPSGTEHFDGRPGMGNRRRARSDRDRPAANEHLQNGWEERSTGEADPAFTTGPPDRIPEEVRSYAIHDDELSFEALLELAAEAASDNSTSGSTVNAEDYAKNP